MSEQLTATVTEIAKALKISRQAVLKRVGNQRWQPTGERVQGGGDCYAIDEIPLTYKERKTIRAHFAKNNVIQLHPTPSADQRQREEAEKERLRIEARAKSAAEFPLLPEWKQRGAKAKLEVISASETFIAANRLARSRGQELFVDEFNMGRADVAPWVREEISRIHVGTLRDWVAKENQQGMMGLVDNYGNRKGQSKIDTYITGQDADGKSIRPYVNALLAIMALEPHVEPKKACEYMLGSCPGGPEVGVRSVERWMKAWVADHPQEWSWICNPDKAKGSFKVSFGIAAEGIEGPNQRWECDATPADLLLIDGRHKILGIIDVGPRRLVLKVSKTERAADNVALVRDRLLAWGVPFGGTVFTDNGAAYTAEHFMRCLRDLDIDQHICQPFASEEKPFIERAFHTFSHDLVEHVPGYCGHSVADRKDIEARASFAKRLMKKGEVIEIKMTAAQLQEFCDRWLNIYHHTEHSSLGKSPFQALAEWPHPIHRIVDERALDVMFAPVAGKNGWRTITKEGFDIDTFNYIHESFGLHVGKKVRCLETADMGKVVVQLPNEQGVMEFLCVAECPELTGLSRAEVTAKGQALQKQVKEAVNELKKQARKHFGGKSSAEIIMALREEKIAEKMGNVAFLPKPATDYTSAGLEAAGLAASALAGTAKPAAPVLTPDQQAMKERLKAELEAKPTTNVRNLETESARGKFKRMQGLRAVLTDGGCISEEEYKALMIYEQSNEYRVFKGLEEESAKAVK